MTKKALIIASFLFLISVLIMPLAMPYCGSNGFYIGLESSHSFCGHGIDLAHISFMRSLIFVGLITSVYILATVIFARRIISLITDIKKVSFKTSIFLLKQLLLGRMKPFDELLRAYASGVVQPKTFCMGIIKDL